LTRGLAKPLRGSTTTKEASDSTARPNRLHAHTHSPKRLAPCTPALAHAPLSILTARAALARPLHPEALASVPSGIVLVRVRVLLPRHAYFFAPEIRTYAFFFFVLGAPFGRNPGPCASTCADFPTYIRVRVLIPDHQRKSRIFRISCRPDFGASLIGWFYFYFSKSPGLQEPQRKALRLSQGTRSFANRRLAHKTNLPLGV
jgi:hypothetical protein